MKTIKLSDNQYALLLEVINAHIDELDGQSCNDIFPKELKRYSTEELQEMLETAGGKRYAKEQHDEWANDGDGTWADALKSGWGMFSSFPAHWLLAVIKKQAKRKA
jgi:hypothetical protein